MYPVSRAAGARCTVLVHTSMCRSLCSSAPGHRPRCSAKASIESLFNDKPVRVFDINGDPYFALVDLEAAWGTKEETIAQMIYRHPELFSEIF